MSNIEIIKEKLRIAAYKMYDIEYSCFIQIPLTNGQMCQPQRPQANYSQVHHLPPQSSVARHPSREQLIDYLMLKVAHQPPYTQSQCSSRQSHELAKQEVRIKSNLMIWHLSVSGSELLGCFHLLPFLCRWWQKLSQCNSTTEVIHYF